jgi:thioester reductase-like protein
MAYTLLTGGTGLLGGFLLRDALRRNMPIAVVVRKTTTRTPSERIDALLAPWETERNLPRPVVLTGDVSQPGLGLSAAERAWVAAHCQRVIHSAASISFYRETESNEPYRSNVEGTRNLLAFCQELGIREFHHVSTAYVCGQRTERVRETELDVGQTWGNDYEQSKVAAEKMVQQAHWLASATIYRPSIIVGDAQSGYTTTFHGFYTPLQVAWWLTQANALKTGLDDWFLAQLGMRGNERKNLVPVDWVSQAIVSLVNQPSAHGKMYHLTNPAPPTVMEISHAIGEVIGRQISLGKQKPLQLPGEVSEADFRKHMEIYRAYFRDDPEFDQSQLQQALPHLPCPRVNQELLVRTGNYAMDANFGWPRPSVPKAPVAWLTALAKLPTASQPSAQSLAVEVTGPGGGTYTFACEGARLVIVERGVGAECSALFRLRGDVFASLLQKQINLEGALRTGRALLVSPVEQMDEVLFTLRQVIMELSTAPQAPFATAQPTISAPLAALEKR